MARLEKPGCTIDWRRVFSLPVCVPPEILAEAETLEYVGALHASAQILFNTFDRFQIAAPARNNVRAAPPGEASRVILPRFTENTVVSEELDLDAATAGTVVDSGPFRATPRDPPADPNLDADDKAADLAAKLEAKLPRDDRANRFMSIPIPYAGIDTIRFYFGYQATAGFAGALGLNEVGLFLDDKTIAAALPKTLLTTRDDDRQSHVEIGELDRLLLRAPVAGRFRFEPYYIYRAGADFKPTGPSTTGRVLVEQPALLTREKRTDRTDTLVYKNRVFAYDHVDRASLPWLIHAHLMMHVRFLDGFSKHFDDQADDPLMIETASSEVFAWIVTDVNHLLRSWTAFLSGLRWRNEDQTVGGEIPADWKDDDPKKQPFLPAKNQGKRDARRLVPIVTQIVGKATWLESLRFFSENVYSPLLGGQTWLEVLESLRAHDPGVPYFPVTKDVPPFTPKNAANDKIALQHDRLRQLEDPRRRWIGCYAGAPIGKPARVYAAAPARGRTFPNQGLTTYEVEALHTAGTAATTLGLPAEVGATAGPRAGRAMDLDPYDGKTDGYTCFFSAEKLAANPLHTTVDFLIELTTGIHFRANETAFLDLHTLEDPATGVGHPLLEPLHADEHNKTMNLRRQMTDLKGAKVGEQTLTKNSETWWEGKAGVSLMHREFYKDDRTRPNRSRGVLAFEDVFPPPVGPNVPSGFDTFDLTSAYLALDRMSQNAATRLPLPVVLALMDFEGVRLFATINRHVKFTKSAASTVVWEALFRDALAVPPPVDIATYPSERPANAHRARKAWLSYPYGLDTFARPMTEREVNARVANMAKNSVFTLDPGEDLIQYIRTRVFSKWVSIAPPAVSPGLPQIWKLSRRMHWAALSLMVGFFRLLEIGINAPTIANKFAQADWTPDVARWLPAGSSPPALVRGDESRVRPADPEWKDYLSYYGLIYLAYNGGPNPWEAGPASWCVLARSAELANPPGSPLSLRDFLLFRHQRADPVIKRMVRFVVGLDAFLRLDLMEGLAPSKYAAAKGDVTPPAGRAWGI